MIKRLKWNVLYGGGGGEESDGGLSSSSDDEAANDEELAARQAQANEILQELVERDPDLAQTLHAKLKAMQDLSDESDDDNDDEEEEGGRETTGAQKQRSGKGKRRGIERYDCSSSDEEEDQLGEKNGAGENGNAENVAGRGDGVEDGSEDEAPGKQFEEHAKSRKHQLKEAQSGKRHTEEARAKNHGPGAQDKSADGSAARVKNASVGEAKEKEPARETRADSPLAAEDEEQKRRRSERRKRKVKRKLKLMKTRKWKKMQASMSGAKNEHEGGVNRESKDPGSAEPTRNDYPQLARCESASRHRSDADAAHSNQRDHRPDNSSSQRENAIETRSAPGESKGSVGGGMRQKNQRDAKQKSGSGKLESHNEEAVGGSPKCPDKRASNSGKRTRSDAPFLASKSRRFKMANTKGPLATPD